MKYTYTEAFDDKENLCGYHRSDGAFVPLDPANSDYQRYLNPEAEQSTPSVIHEAEAK